MGKEVFLSLFSGVVHQCVEAGLVAGSKIQVDASLVDADASLKSVKPLKPEVIRAIEQSAREQVKKLDEQDNEEENQSPSDSGGGAPSTQNPTGSFYKTNRQFRSTSDPDATLVRQGGLKSRPRYKNHQWSMMPLKLSPLWRRPLGQSTKVLACFSH
jgi:hypothetical protein